MKISTGDNICVCHNCGVTLSSRWGQNMYSGGPFSCGNCHSDVTEDIYTPLKKVKIVNIYNPNIILVTLKTKHRKLDNIEYPINKKLWKFQFVSKY